ncbi:Glutathione S-transferase F12 [Linum perenne]
MVVKVYGPLKAACPQRVMVCLLEKEVEFEVIPIDLDSGHQKLPDYVSKQVPFSPLLHRLLYYHTYIVMIIIKFVFNLQPFAAIWAGALHRGWRR